MGRIGADLGQRQPRHRRGDRNLRRRGRRDRAGRHRRRRARLRGNPVAARPDAPRDRPRSPGRRLRGPHRRHRRHPVPGERQAGRRGRLRGALHSPCAAVRRRAGAAPARPGGRRAARHPGHVDSAGGRDRRADRSVELAGLPVHPGARPGAGGRLHGGRENARPGGADRRADERDHRQRSRDPRRSGEHRHRIRLRCRPPAGGLAASAGDQLHRQHRHRSAHRPGRGSALQAGRPGTRRQDPAPDLRRRGPRRRPRHGRGVLHRVRRPVLHDRQPGARPARDRRRVHPGAGGASGERAARARLRHRTARSAR